MRSRSSPIKSMFMGVVGRPKIDKNSDGRILLDRVSKTRAIKKKTHQCFSDDVIINSEIKTGNWKDFYVPKTDMQLDDLKEIIGKNYNLEDDIIDRLEFTYKQKVDNKGKVRYL